MSVAFRRESDEEHKEPRFELPIPPGPNLVTSKGLKQIQERVDMHEALVSEEQDEARLAEAQRDLRYWRTRLATAQLGPEPPEGQVAFGTRVQFRLKGARRTLDIVGDDEADPPKGRIAFSAPLARAMMGAEPGDVLAFGGDPAAIEVLGIEPIG